MRYIFAAMALLPLSAAHAVTPISRTETLRVEVGGEVYVTARCPAGSSVTGGGYLVYNNRERVRVLGSYPSTPSAWTVRMLNAGPYGGTFEITAYAICG